MRTRNGIVKFHGILSFHLPLNRQICPRNVQYEIRHT